MAQNPQAPMAWKLLTDVRHRIARATAIELDRLNTETAERLRRSTERAWWMEH